MSQSKPRIDWVDAAKGLTMTLVVMKHATYNDAAVLHQVPYLFNFLCEFTIPFRMPLFFLVAGLFAMRALKSDLRTFIDGKVLHFVYFYLLWSVIQIGLKIVLPHDSEWAVSYRDLLMIPFEPFGLLWFIYELSVFFVAMRLLRDVRKPIVIGFALVLYFSKLHTGWTIPDEFAQRFIFFVSGVYGAPYVFRMAEWTRAHMRQALAVSAAMLLAAGAIVFSGAVDLRPMELLTGYIGGAATLMLVVTLVARGWAGPLTYIGSRSLYVFLAFFLPMAATRTLLVKLGFHNGDLITLACIAMAVGMPLLGYRIVRDTPLAFVFVRPQAFRLKPSAKTADVAATA
ncbi:acyltransferase family protein [Parvibaculum sp.]|uniref:acyltransferase family protein n=1 Tax=Parvibaculum sp. TaxID=2024848 RepID=UPI002CFE371F|nr:acyltransferase family protein [Parvibaculum sp.]HUD49925.1 acyltransferase family protein [Parvibaculum sp.]